MISELLKKIRYIKYDILKSKNLALDAKIFWSKSNHDTKFQDLSHWRGVGRFNEENWLGIGKRHYEYYQKLLRMLNKEKETTVSILEWGGGGGANAHKFCKELNANYYDIDISLSNLEEAERQVKNFKNSCFYPVLLDNPSDFSKIKDIEVQFDFFLSTAVFQHFPSRDYGISVLEVGAEKLKKGGVFIIQIRFSEHSKPVSTNYFRDAIDFTTYGITEFEQILKTKKLTVIDKVIIEEDKYCYYLGVKEK